MPEKKAVCVNQPLPPSRIPLSIPPPPIPSTFSPSVASASRALTNQQPLRAAASRQRAAGCVEAPPHNELRFTNRYRSVGRDSRRGGGEEKQKCDESGEERGSFRLDDPAAFVETGKKERRGARDGTTPQHPKHTGAPPRLEPRTHHRHQQQ